jgi:hypothetical protein
VTDWRNIAYDFAIEAKITQDKPFIEEQKQIMNGIRAIFFKYGTIRITDAISQYMMDELEEP